MALGTKLLIILLAISTALSLSGYNDMTITGNNSTDDITGQFGFAYNHTSDTLSVDEAQAKAGIIVASNDTNIIQGVINFVDRYMNVQKWIETIFSFVTAPVGVLQSVSAPDGLVLIVGAIWGVLWAVAIASFIWRTPF